MVEPKGVLSLLLDNKPLGFVGSGLRGDGLALVLLLFSSLGMKSKCQLGRAAYCLGISILTLTSTR